jgi:hypothetical protein
MMMTPTEYSRRLHEHVRGFFLGHGTRYQPCDHGPIQQALPGFHAIEVEPGPLLSLTAYVSVGSGADDTPGHEHLEFVTVAGEPSERHVELLAMTAYYHYTGERLGVGHTFPIGEPWVPGSKLDHMLVSLPYPFGPKLEYLSTDHAKARILWLLPITKAELEYKKRAGLDALEERFDSAALEYWRPDRESVV